MKKFELSSVFLIGHEDIDADHAELVDILNDMADAHQGSDLDGCYTKWQSFWRRLEIHFADEEVIMRDFGFEDGKDHKLEHEEMIAMAKSLGAGCKTLEDWEKCLFSLRDSLLTAILRHDIKFAEHLVTIGFNPV